jgi:trans-aconitate methyltransferase
MEGWQSQAYSDAPEKHYTLKGIGGSNPSPSANVHSEFYTTFPYPDPKIYQCACGKIDVKYQTAFHLKNAENKKILVAGCGTVEGVLIARQYKDSQVHAVDLSTASLKLSEYFAQRENLNNIFHECADLMFWEPETKFDLIVACGVIHHVRDDVKLLRRLRSWMTDDGHLYGMVYNETGREHISIMEDLPKTPTGVQVVKQRLEALPATHPSHRWYEEHDKGNEEIADTWLNPFFRNYTESSFKCTLITAGFRAIKIYIDQTKLLFTGTNEKHC